MSRHFKKSGWVIPFYLNRDKTSCIKENHSNTAITFELERFQIFVQITDCSDCVRTMVNAINRCRSKRQLYLLLTKLSKDKKENYTDGNNRKDSGIEAENAILSV
jgi:hypothetical protein